MATGTGIDMMPVFRPNAELSMRNEPHGGGLRESPEETPAGRIGRAKAVTLLIHGYNVNAPDARHAYDEFNNRLPPSGRKGQVWALWPGDRHANILLSTLAYPWTLHDASKSGDRIAKYLSKAVPDNAKLELRIVAHSLGCRLALHLVKYLAAAPHVQVKLLVLMAPAVPLFLVQQHSLFALDELEVEYVKIFFSKNDRVLKAFFRPGQRLEMAGPGTLIFNRGALGRKGLGRSARAFAFSNKVKVEEHETALWHGGYWQDDAVAWEVATRLTQPGRRLENRWLGRLAELDPRDLSERNLGLLPARQFRRRPVAARHLSGRSL